MSTTISVFWFRRDLRLSDNAGLYHALKSGHPVLPVFIFDKNILDKLEDKIDRRVAFIHAAIHSLQQQLQAKGSTLHVLYDTPENAFKTLLNTYQIAAVYTNHDYEQYAIERDTAIMQLLNDSGISFNTYKDHVIFEKDEVVKDNHQPYTVFTPYSKRWKSVLNDFYVSTYPTEEYANRFVQLAPIAIPTLQEMHFSPSEKSFPSPDADEEIIRKYSDTRDFPANEKGTSRLGVHLRFGTISIRRLARIARTLNETYLNELIWRDFYQMILWHFPHVGAGKAFRAEYDQIQWRNNEAEFERWCNGTTGYPIVDAGMRELNETGFMHNRVRMIVASFLSKHLLIDWRWGEAYFAQKLLDFDFASNNGGWQWAAGSGCDAVPYFRVFNPYLQTTRFDPQLTYVKRWVPELNELTYPTPIVQHEMARKRALEVYGKTLKK